MDTTSEIMMKLLDDLYSGDENKLTAPYSKYYDSLDTEQSKEVVKGAINRILNENANTRCEFGDDTFTLVSE